MTKFNFNPECLKKRFPFFEQELLEEIATHGYLKEIEENEELMREGQFIKSFPLVLEGLVRISRIDDDGHELLLYYLNPGEVCAMSLTCCMDQTRSNIKGVTEMPSVIIRIPVPKLDKWMTEYQSWKAFVMYAYRKRFDELLETIDGVAFMKMDERLLKFFIDRYRSTHQTTFKGTHQEIALALNSSREVISRLLKKLERDNKITISRNKIDYSPLI